MLNGRVRLSDSSATSNGFGWHLTAIPERLSGCMLGVAIVPVLRHYGNHCHQSTVNAPFVTLIFGLHMSRFFPKTDAVGEENGKTNRIERFNLTLRQRISRLVRKMLSFSKKIEAHTGAIWNFIHYYNAEIAPKLAITTYDMAITAGKSAMASLSKVLSVPPRARADPALSSSTLSIERMMW